MSSQVSPAPSASSLGFCVDSIRVTSVVCGGGGTIPPIEKLEGASGIVVAVPRGRPQRATGRFQFQTMPPKGLTGSKRPREDAPESRHPDVPLGGVGPGETRVSVGGGAATKTLAELNVDIQSRFRAATSSNASAMLAMELARTRSVKAIALAMDGAVVSSFVPGSELYCKLRDALVATALEKTVPDQHAAERPVVESFVQRAFAFAQGGTNAKKAVSISAPTGLFPALVFECLSSEVVVEAERADPIIPSPMGRRLGGEGGVDGAPAVSHSLSLRLVSHYHDLLNRGLVLFGSAEGVRSAAEVCARVASRHLCALVDAMFPVERANIVAASASAETSPVVVSFHSSKGTALQTFEDEGVRYVVLSSSGRRHEMTLRSYSKLRYLFAVNSAEARSQQEGPSTTAGTVVDESELHNRLFMLLERYYQLLGSSSNFRQEGGWHAAMPVEVLRTMSGSIGVDCEGFSNPFNTSSTRY